ncbi:hypothetical protein F1559_001178 [Cyanidiococcus yangmingshanensis]|uniref:J domain-containing protein n=1 Tax=Cyanidiococcus yangmingshanensis TaxID=2690220 RepID=A0A7J7IF96_9RHOD|nr:hypothetical protein F1559_001178 [Cyanidiococcus yangmingshanensis]
MRPRDQLPVPVAGSRERSARVVRTGVLLLSSRSTVQFDSSEDYYAILGLDKNADLSTIKRAYRRLALQNHPDANKDPQAREKFIRILRAYEVLSNDEARKRYDAQRLWQTVTVWSGRWRYGYWTSTTGACR